MTSTPGYSGTPLPKKLGLKDGQRVLFVDLPDALDDLPQSRDFAEVRQAGWDDWVADTPWDVVHGFTRARETLAANAKPLMDAIARDGMIWVSWPKKASKVATDITEDTIREVVLPLGLVDVKVAAVSDIWSGLKLVIRKELR
ncbi:DUF3052 domain-containing protein [Devosia sp.]|uniref:DUF3052 domain-containing protein n=1 Tax=Devosia sp. TaxID=1871048 RepID=UPI003A90EAC6